MVNRNIMPRWAQLALAIALLAIAFGVGTLTMTLNFMFGWSRHWTMAVGFMLTDTAKLSLPLAARRFGWTPYFRCAFGICLVISVYAALSCWLTESGQILLDAGKTEATATAARRALSDAEAKLSGIAETATPQALTAQIDAAKTKLAEMTKAARAAGIECAQRTKCSDAQSALSKLLDRQGNAEARVALQKQRSEALAALEITKEHALGLPDYVAAFLGQDRSAVARFDSILGTALFITAMEILGVLSFYGATLLATTAPNKREREPVATEPEPARDAGHIHCLARLTTLIKSADGGYIEIPHAELAERLRTPRATLQDWITRWQLAGYIETKIVKGGRRQITLADRAKMN